VNSFEAGRRAEAAAAAFLVRKKCTIVAQNWRTRRCEIDIIALRDGCIFFCEVKYRRTNHQGAGLDYITPAKLRQMQFAAESWVHRYAWGGRYQLCALEVSGADFRVSAVVKDL
jgi:ribonuclease HII